jgi:hypothetical protein
MRTKSVLEAPSRLSSLTGSKMHSRDAEKRHHGEQAMSLRKMGLGERGNRGVELVVL